MKHVAVFLVMVVVGCQKQADTPPAVPSLSESQVKKMIDESVSSAKLDMQKDAKKTDGELRLLIEKSKQEAIARIDVENKGRMADNAKRAFEKASDRLDDDMRKYATLDTKDLMTFVSIKKKKDSGEPLNDDELRLAVQFDALRDFTKIEVEKRAKARGFPTDRNIESRP